MLNTQNNFRGFKAKASEVAHSSEGACLCGLFLAVTVAKPMGTLSQGIASRHADQGQPLLRSGGDLCSAFTSVPSTNTQTKGCPGRRLLHLHRQQPKHRLWASGIFVCFFPHTQTLSPSVPSTLQSQGHRSHHILSAAKTSSPLFPIHR